MNSHWAETWAKQHIDEMERDAVRARLARQARPGATPDPRSTHLLRSVRRRVRMAVRRVIGAVPATELSLRGIERG